MKKVGVFFFVCLFTLHLAADQLVADGYYRARNSDTGRYITVIDGYGKIDYQSTSVDLGAIQTDKRFDTRVNSDPASIIYSQYVASADGYIFYCQGTNTYKITGEYLKIRVRNGKYWLYATKKGTTLYLSDLTNRDRDTSSVTTDDATTKNWETLLLNSTSTNYFGMKAAFTYGGSNYLSFYASFPFSFYSNGMEAYYVTEIDQKFCVAVWKKWEAKDIPQSMPVIVKCANTDATNNRIDIHASSQSAPSNNLLKGVYFLRERQQKDNPHRAVTENDTATMRVLGVLSNGKLGMKKYTGANIPKNTAYLKVPAGSPDELMLMTADEYEEYKRIMPVENISSARQSDIIYDLTGQPVKVTSRAELKKGIYIINGKKVIVKD